MPVMKMPDMIPDWADPKQASVMDPLYKTLARRAVSTLGLDDPSNMIMQAAAPNVMPLVSIFKDKAEREASTKMFKLTGSFMPDSVRKGMDRFAARWPRVAAHMDPAVVPDEPSAYLNGRVPAGYARTSNLPVTPAKIGITYKGLDSINNSADPAKEAFELMKHEGTHVAQKLGNKNFSGLYDGAHDLVGYDKNPFERTARFSEKAVPETDQEVREAWNATRDSVAEQLRQKNISLDSSWGPRGATAKLRKWGAPNVPENMIDPTTMPTGIQKKLEIIHTNPDSFGFFNQPKMPKPRVNAIDLLKNDLKEKSMFAASDDPVHKVADKLKAILEDRARRGWTPSEQD